jgi:hypothetical protein
MPDYRLYLLNLHSGHIDGVEEFHSADHVEAICLTSQRNHEVPTELWCGGHKVARFDARPEQAAMVPPSWQPGESSSSPLARSSLKATARGLFVP